MNEGTLLWIPAIIAFYILLFEDCRQCLEPIVICYWSYLYHRSNIHYVLFKQQELFPQVLKRRVLLSLGLETWHLLSSSSMFHSLELVSVSSNQVSHLVQNLTCGRQRKELSNSIYKEGFTQLRFGNVAPFQLIFYAPQHVVFASSNQVLHLMLSLTCGMQGREELSNFIYKKVLLSIGMEMWHILSSSFMFNNTLWSLLVAIKFYIW